MSYIRYNLLHSPLVFEQVLTRVGTIRSKYSRSQGQNEVLSSRKIELFFFKFAHWHFLDILENTLDHR